MEVPIVVLGHADGLDVPELKTIFRKRGSLNHLFLTNFPAFSDSKKFQLIGLETHVSTASSQWYRQYLTDSGSMVPTIFDEFQIESDTESTPYYQYHFENSLKGPTSFSCFGIPRRKNEEKSIFLALRRSLREDYQEVFLSYVFGPISFHVSSNQSDGRLFVL